MKPKIIKFKSELFNSQIVLTVDENLNKLKGKNQFPQKLEEANNTLTRFRNELPK